jgi:hypothetical protein
MMHGAGESHQRAIVRRGKNSVVHRAESLASDTNEVKALHGLHGLRRECRENAQLIEDSLAVRLDRLASKSSRRTQLPFQDKDGNALLSERQAQDRPAAPRPYHDDFTFQRQSS